MDLHHELAFAEGLARRAGAMAIELRHTISVTHKPDNQGPVTNADVMIDQFICAGLSQEFAKDRIVSEENPADHGSPIASGRTWFVDPIDGTASFISGNRDFVVMIGLAIDGVARLGVIYQPIGDHLWRGIVGVHAQKITGGEHATLAIKDGRRPERLRILASRSHGSRRQKELIAETSPHEVIYRSSVGIKAMLIAEQQADLYVAWSNRIKMWDTCAPCAIVRAAGGTVSFVDGQPLNFSGLPTHNRAIVVANFSLDRELAQILERIATG